MSKWTLTRKTRAIPKSGFHNLRKGCFKMKVDHCKNQGAIMCEFEKPIVKLQVEIRSNNPITRFAQARQCNFQDLLRHGTQNDHEQIPGTGMG